MADAGPCTAVERLEAVFWYQDRKNTKKTIKQMGEDFEEGFGKPA
jgi:hypothetical protein